MINQPINAFLVGANKKLGSTSECLLLSEIYVRGLESTSFVMSREYVEKVFGIKRTSQINYYDKFVKLGLCKIEVRGNKRIVKPNMKKITKFIEEGTEELLGDLDNSNVSYEIKNPKSTKKTKIKKDSQNSLLKTSYKSKINYEYLVDSKLFKEYKNRRASGDTFKGRDGVFYNLSKLDDAITSNDFSSLTATDYVEYFILIYEEFYKTAYPKNIRDISNMKKFIGQKAVKREEMLDWFICFMDRYTTLGYSSDQYPRFNIWALTTEWVVNGLIENRTRNVKKPKIDGVVRWNTSAVEDVDLYEESDEEF